MSRVFPPDFLVTLRGLIAVHQSIYARVPSQGIYFEALVEEAFKRIKKPFTKIEPTGRNQPRHDLLVEDTRLSLKTETGAGTDPDRIAITKLCTTEREPWTPRSLVARAIEHLARYDVILMLRAVWEPPTSGNSGRPSGSNAESKVSTSRKAERASELGRRCFSREGKSLSRPLRWLRRKVPDQGFEYSRLRHARNLGLLDLLRKLFALLGFSKH